MDGQKGVVAGRHAEGVPGVAMVGGERHTVVTHRHDSPDLKGTVDATVSTKSYSLDCSSLMLSMHLDTKCNMHMHQLLISVFQKCN